MKSTKKSLTISVVALLLCFSMLLGATYAWFTDAATSNSNIVQAGKLDAEMYWSDTLLATDSDAWKNAEGVPIFTYDNWEPGYTDVKYVKVKNAGNLAFQWRLSIEAQGNVTDLADVIDVYYINPVTETVTTLSGKTTAGVLSNVINTQKYTNGVLLPAGETSTDYASGEIILAIALHMQEDAENHYRGKSIGDGFSIRLIATQFNYEEDGFGNNNYDETPEWPENVTVGGNSASAAVVPTSDNKVSAPVSLVSTDGVIGAEVPAGVKLNAGVNKVTLNVRDVENSQANVTLNENEAALSINVHINGVAADNDVVMAIAIKELLPVGLNIGNYRFYHVEDGQTVEMILLTDGAVAEHNNYEYDPATGDVVLYLKSFSEFALVADIENAWEGNVATSFAGGSGTEEDPYLIANADQFVYFGDLISNDNGNYGNKYYKLIADINLGGDDENADGHIFYPIGYHKVGGNVANVDVDDAPEFIYHEEDPGYSRPSIHTTAEGEATVWYTYGGSFKGVFDGNGNTISNVYQNTWQMRGNYDGHYYKEAMGIFGYVNGGTVKNLTVNNFTSDGEFTPTGVIAAYAAGEAIFENIAIINCNPRVYNTGNGGIIGIAGSTSAANDDHIILKNITVDNSNKISALWGSWDVACGGLVGMYRGNVDGSGNATGDTIKFDNCHVSAQIDVYNDVCANYQYYAYRYSGMIIGSVRHNTTSPDGRTIPNMAGISASGCTVNYGDWNDYYYCEFEKNTIASYSEDYQFSRVDKSEIIFDEDGNAIGCIHTHTEAEDKRAVYLPFYQLFTGYSWGVSSIGLKEYSGIVTNLGITEGDQQSSVEKFEGKVNERVDYTTYNLSDIFNFVDNGVVLIPSGITVTVINKDESNPVSAEINYDRKNWENTTITFTGVGEITITIQDYYFCTPTTISVSVKGHEHKYDNSCDVTCNVCGATREIEHTVVIDAAKAPTCTATGLTEGKHCSVCNEVLVAQEVVAAKGHTEDAAVEENVVGSTCTGEGSYDRVVYCSVCEAELSREKVTVDVIPHTYNTVVTAPTCTEGGYTTYTCSCGHTYIADEVAASGHKYNAAVTAPTCTEKGYTTYTCSCGDTYTADEVEALGHSYDAAVTAPTCTESGYTTYTCSCGDTYTADEVAALGPITTNFTGAFLYRVGNQNDVALSSLFNVGNRNVTVKFETISGNASVTINGTSLTFSGIGVVKVTLTSDCTCGECVLELTLEVVDAVNATSATSATKNNVVLLNDCEFSSLEVSGGYTLYGNGFTLTCGSDSPALDTGYAFVNLDNGTLDNVQIVLPNFDYAVLYKSNMTESGNRSQTTDKTRYYNVKSGVMVSGNSQILNSRISGARAAVNVTGGNCLIDNSRIELGAVASLLIGSANSVTLRDVTLVQKPTASTYDSSKTLMGFSVLFVCDADGNTAPVTIEGTLVQNAWVDESDKQYVPSAGQSIISTVLGKTDYLHDLDGDGTKESLNLGFAYMPESLTSKVNTTTITDNRTNKNNVPYAYAEVSILNGKTYVYSYKNTNGTADSFKTEVEYEPKKQGDIITVTYSDTKDGLEQGKSFGTDGWVYELNVDLDKASGYKLDFSKLSMTINGVPVTDYKVNDGNKPSTVAVTAGGVTYTLTATIDGKEYTTTFKVTGTETSKESPSKISGPTTAGFGVAKSYGSDWSGAADVLTGVKIKYWSVAENKYVEFDFSNFTVPGNAGKLNGTNSYWEYTHTNNDFTLKVTNTVAIHSGKSVYGMPIRGTDGKLYFTISSTNGYVGSGTTSRAITMQYEFTDNNGGEKLTFTHTFNISYSKGDQYSYSDLSGSGKLTKLTSSSGGTCLAEGTMITLADGTKKAVEDIRRGDVVMAFDHITGEIVYKDVILVGKTYADSFCKNVFVFDDGTELVAINAHGIYDLDLGMYVNIGELNYQDYIGHRFVSIDANGNIGVKRLVDVVITVESGYKYDIVTNGTLNYVAEDTLSVSHEIVIIMNSFNFGDNALYDIEAMQADIEQYGLYTYEDFAEYCDFATFEKYNMAMMKVGVEKGLYTKEHLIYLLTEIALNDNVQITN